MGCLSRAGGLGLFRRAAWPSRSPGARPPRNEAVRRTSYRKCHRYALQRRQRASSPKEPDFCLSRDVSAFPGGQMSSLSSPQESLSRANVIKWTETLPHSRNSAAPVPPVARSATRAWRRQRRAPGPAPGCWPLPGARPTCPLPDPALARLCAVPDPAPPYDDNLQANRPLPGGGNAGDRPAANRSAQARPGVWAKAGSHGDAGGSGARPAEGGSSDRRGNGQQPDAEDQPGTGRPPWPSQFAQVLAETLAGSRPPRQLTPWTTERARGHIRRLGPLLAGTQEPRIRRIVASTPSLGVVEMAVVVRFGPRVHALAVRLERGDTSHVSAWQCTAIEAA